MLHMNKASPFETYKTLREHLNESFLAHGRVATYLRRHTALLDRMVVQTARNCGISPDHCLVAVGGYGRAEMFPYSDLDLLVLLPEHHNAQTDARVSQFVTELWNFGLTVGSVVRTQTEMLKAATEDISIATSFLEARRIAGSKTLFEQTYAAFLQQLNAKSFFRSKMLEMRQRHQRHADTPYALEPNLKESPGGMRDLQVFLWCVQVAGYGRTWRDLSNADLITETEAYYLAQCQHFLHDLRIRLHLLRGRHEDRLVFDVQTALAQNAGYKPSAGLTESEMLMKRYYLNAKNIVQLNAILLQAIADRLFDQELACLPVHAIDETFFAKGDSLDIIDNDVFKKDPASLLRVFFVYASHRELKRFSTGLLRALWHSRHLIDTKFRNSESNKMLFMQIIKLHYGSYHCLKNMNIWGVLGRFLPVFRRIVGQMQHDLFHAYTVDQHTMRTVKFLRRFAHSSYAHEYPLCSQVMTELSDAWRLTLAGLFHDIAKGRGGSHSELGAQEFITFGQSFGMKHEDIEYIAFLVKNHLTMSTVAQKQDVTDPTVIERFAALVQNKERLAGLFLLTVADIRATSPKVWNAWKQQLLEDLYKATAHCLDGSGSARTRATVFAEHRQKAIELVASKGVDAQVCERFWQELNIVYFLRHGADDIAWHACELALNPSPDTPIVQCRQTVNQIGIEVLVYARDQKDLFARVVAFFERQGLSVFDARIHTTRHGWALDTFLVQDRREREDLERLLMLIRTQLTKVISDCKPLPKPATGRLSRRSRCFPTVPLVDIERDESQQKWVLQIICNDRLGLLFAIAVVLAKYSVNLETAKISTLDERAEDVFLITGDILKDTDGIVALENDLLDAINDAK